MQQKIAAHNRSSVWTLVSIPFHGRLAWSAFHWYGCPPPCSMNSVTAETFLGRLASGGWRGGCGVRCRGFTSSDCSTASPGPLRGFVLVRRSQLLLYGMRSWVQNTIQNCSAVAGSRSNGGLRLLIGGVVCFCLRLSLSRHVHRARGMRPIGACVTPRLRC